MSKTVQNRAVTSAVPTASPAAPTASPADTVSPTASPADTVSPAVSPADTESPAGQVAVPEAGLPSAGPEPAPPERSGPGLAGIATWSAPTATETKLVPRSERTGEPRRVWSIWVASVAGYLATAVLGASTLWIYWNAAASASLIFDQATNEWSYSYDGARFGQASWLMGQFETEPGSGGRVLLAVAVTAIAVAIGVACCITAYYAYDGRRWTRWSALIALAMSAMALMLNTAAWGAIVLAAVMAAVIWLPTSTRYFAAWQAHRHRGPVFSPAVGMVRYGPLPRYR